MPPFPGIPYHQAPAYCFPLFEFAMYLLFIVCLWDAMKRGSQHVAYMLGGLAFGLLLEYIEVISGMGYTYEKFMIMFGRGPMDIPLCIGVGWSIIIYTSRLFSDSLHLPWWAGAAMDALLAINIDLSMDTVAYRLHMWHWNWEGSGLDPLKAQWFGVPYGNFFGWLMVIFFYAYFSRLFEKIFAKKMKAVKVIVVPVIALICSQVLLYAMEAYIEQALDNTFGITSLQRLIAFLLILAVIIIAGWRLKKKSIPAPFITWLVPAWFHIFFFMWLFLAGFYKENRWLVIAACINLLIGFIIHTAALRSKAVVQK